MEALLDFSRPTDVGLLDKVVLVFYSPADPQRQHAERVLTAFKEHPDSWTRVDSVLEASQSQETKFFALQILENQIKYKWKSLPADQRESIKTYLVQKIIALSSDERTLRTQSLFIKKLNLLLVQVLKHEWPAQVLCENNIAILKLLSEEVFDFSKESMTAARAEALKSNMTDQFAMIFQLLEFILQASTKPALITETLQTLQRFVTWIPDKFIFETALLPLLCSKFLPVPAFRVDTLLVLTEVASLAKPQYNQVFEQLYVAVMEQLVRVVPPHVNIKEAFSKGSASDQTFIRHLALFLTAYFRSHIELMEGEHYRSLLESGLNYVVKISDIDDAEVFKICLEYWQKLANDLYSIEIHYTPALPSQVPGVSDAAMASMFGRPNQLPGAGAGSGAAQNPRKAIYAEILSRVREVMINHMAKPEEILIEKDDTGEIVREQTKDTEALAVYKVMKDTLVFLTHLDPTDTERIMLDKLTKQVDGSEWSWDSLNCLCWAIGSISGTFTEADEKRFLVTVIKDLLGLVEAKKGKNNKAVVASNIMYVVGQHPRFLRAHWKFLKTVVIKLFEFMHEKHPGVQDMAVDTFLKIAQKCKKKFVQLQPGEQATFIEELCVMLPSIIQDLESHQVLTFYEAAGQMVSAHPDAEARYELTNRLMALYNNAWGRLIASANADINTFQNVEVLKELQKVLRTNVAACRSIGPSFDRQLAKRYMDYLNVYKALSGMIKHLIATSPQGEYIIQSTVVKAMRSVKKEVLNLVSTFVNLSENTRFVAEHFVPPLLEPVLGDYASSIPGARDAEVLNVMTEVINKLKTDITSEAPKILEAVFEPTLQMITANFEDFPEHRMSFFRLLEAINAHTFAALFQIPPKHQALVVDSIIWAFKHTARDIGETGLNILQSLIDNVAAAGPELSQPFFLSYALTLIRDLLQALSDRLHRAHFKQHATILRQLFHLVESGRITVPLWESPLAVSSGAAASFQASLQAAAAANGGVIPPHLLTNQQFVREYVKGLVTTSFPNLGAPQVQSFVSGLFDMGRDLKAYKTHLRDFLIQVLEFKSGDGADSLFAEEHAAAQKEDLERRKAVPGLLNPYQQQEMDEL